MESASRPMKKTGRLSMEPSARLAQASSNATPESNCCRVFTSNSPCARSGRTKKSISAVKRGYPCYATAKPPTTRYSTLFALSKSINSSKSLLGCIGVESRLKLEHDGDPLFWGHGSVFGSVRSVGFLKAVKDADNLLHFLILLLEPRGRKTEDGLASTQSMAMRVIRKIGGGFGSCV